MENGYILMNARIIEVESELLAQVSDMAKLEAEHVEFERRFMEEMGAGEAKG